MNRTTFYNQKDFDADIRMSKEYINEDMGLTIYLYSINITASKKDIYGESMPNEKEFLGPYKLSVWISIPPSEKTKIGGSMLVNENVETVKLGVYTDELDKLGIDIKRGDYFTYDDNDTSTTKNGDVFKVIENKLKGLLQELGGNEGKSETKKILVNTKKICDLECAKCMMTMISDKKSVKTIDLENILDDETNENCIKCKKYTELSNSIKSIIDNF
jgi:hypothetical protein